MDIGNIVCLDTKFYGDNVSGGLEAIMAKATSEDSELEIEWTNLIYLT
jgi:hypothetical protein